MGDSDLPGREFLKEIDSLTLCCAESDDGYVCTLPLGHAEDEHESKSPDGSKVVRWPDVSYKG